MAVQRTLYSTIKLLMYVNACKYFRGWCRKVVYLAVLVFLMHVLLTVFREKDSRWTASTSSHRLDKYVKTEPDFLDTDTVKADDQSVDQPEQRNVERFSLQTEKQAEESSVFQIPASENQSDTNTAEELETPKTIEKPFEGPEKTPELSEDVANRHTELKQSELNDIKMKKEQMAEEAILEKMKSNMLKENLEDSLNSLVKPKDILKEAVGPVRSGALIY